MCLCLCVCVFFFGKGCYRAYFYVILVKEACISKLKPDQLLQHQWNIITISLITNDAKKIFIIYLIKCLYNLI